MLVTKLKTAAGILLATAVAAGGAGVLAQHGSDSDRTPRSSSSRVRYEIRVTVDGKPRGEPIIAEVAEGSDITTTTPHESIHIDRTPGRGWPRGPGMSGMAMGMMQPGAGPSMMMGQPGAENPAKKGIDARRKDRSRSLGNSPTGGGPPEGGMMPGGMMSGMGHMMGGGMMANNVPGASGPASSESGDQMAGMMGRMGGPRGMMMGDAPLRDQDQRLREVERKLDEILKRLDDRKSETAK